MFAMWLESVIYFWLKIGFKMKYVSNLNLDIVNTDFVLEKLTY